MSMNAFSEVEIRNFSQLCRQKKHFIYRHLSYLSWWEKRSGRRYRRGSSIGKRDWPRRFRGGNGSSENDEDVEDEEDQRRWEEGLTGREELGRGGEKRTIDLGSVYLPYAVSNWTIILCLRMTECPCKQSVELAVFYFILLGHFMFTDAYRVLKNRRTSVHWPGRKTNTMFELQYEPCSH